jgi:hypothetical protein
VTEFDDDRGLRERRPGQCEQLGAQHNGNAFHGVFLSITVSAKPGRLISLFLPFLLRHHGANCRGRPSATAMRQGPENRCGLADARNFVCLRLPTCADADWGCNDRCYFEVWPASGAWTIISPLRPRCALNSRQVDGFISVERFQSLTEPGKLLSLSFWRDERQCATGAIAKHRESQAEDGRAFSPITDCGSRQLCVTMA